MRAGHAAARPTLSLAPLACSWGNPTPGNAAYGATKRALVQLKDSLAAEVQGSGV